MHPVERPLSPHLQIYRPQLTSTLSILHRITGFFLTLGATALVLWLLSIAYGPEWFLFFRTLCDHIVGRLFLAGISFSYFFHLFNGIRHLIWDSGHGYALPAVYRGGYMVLILTVIATVLIWLLITGF